ncbi:Crp/Fnr family transcriptional regulator [Maribacter sp. UBA4516]|uniref:Crp/Fnr family transcriptional regulator n=1 Tax=Maribacter sp. UBA4516 TaxID=1946804 RepID=UPI002579E15F|nr:Crp/Fnr family transcriptional regulator [Maribacter sp. UBA4516]|tara:strand:+ start:262 stop:834 length:573 start_codon:yes stop_codon:yes gene_type:complete
MKTILIDTLKEKINISDKEKVVLTDYFQITTKKKNEYLVNEGSSSSYLYFIIDGYVRCFFNNDGNEITTQISTNKDFITSFESFLNNNSSKENIQCISDCLLLRISKTNYENLYSEISDWSVFCKSVYEEHIMKISDRTNSLQNLSASERYLKLLNTQPNIALNTAIKHLASYLGIKPQSLSRIRKEVFK